MDVAQDLSEPLVAESEAAAELEAGPADPPREQRSHRALSVQGSGKRRCQDVGVLWLNLLYFYGRSWDSSGTLFCLYFGRPFWPSEWYCG